MKKNALLLLIALCLVTPVFSNSQDVDLTEAISHTTEKIHDALQTKNIKINPSLVIQNVEEALFKAVDSSFEVLTHEQAELLMKRINGFFYRAGLSIEFESGTFVVTEVQKNSPADKVGIAKGNVVQMINGETLTKENVESLLALLKSESVSEVELTFLSKPDSTEAKTVSFALELLQTPVVSVFESWPHDICYMKIEGFYPGSGQEIIKGMQAWKSGVFYGIVLDMRGANGSDFKSVVAVSGLFLDGDKPIFELVDDTDSVVKLYKTPEGVEKIDMPVIVLVDNRTCLAAEVMAAIFKASKGAILLGSPTLGDNKVRDFIEYDDQLVFIAVNRIRMLIGDDFAQVGVTPDILERNGADSAGITVEDKKRLVQGGITEEEKQDLQLLRKIGGDIVLRRATDIMLGLKALDIQTK